jgi:hypothetical protein
MEIIDYKLNGLCGEHFFFFFYLINSTYCQTCPVNNITSKKKILNMKKIIYYCLHCIQLTILEDLVLVGLPQSGVKHFGR